MVSQPVGGDVFPFGARLSVVAVGVNGNAATGQELTPYFNVFRVQQTDEILHDDIDTVLMEISVVAEGKQVEL